MDSFEKLKEIFEHFPGIGPRQAERFAYYLLGRDVSYLEELRGILGNLKRDVSQCTECKRFFGKKGGTDMCGICSDPNRDRTLVMIVAKDNDLHTIEKSGAYNGLYFVLGGLVPILEKNPERRIRIEALRKKISESKDAREIIFALSATHEGEHTADYLVEEMGAIKSLKFTRLGRGLSTGLEIEYSDSDTIKAALENKR